MKPLNKIILPITLLLLAVTACSDEPKSKLGNVSKQEVHEIFLQGQVKGRLNGSDFTFGKPNERESKLRTSGGQTSLVLTVGHDAYVAVIIVSGYDGNGNYQDNMSVSPFMKITSPKDKFKTVEKTLTITDDDETKLAGNFSFEVLSSTNEKIIVDGSFGFKKLIWDLNDDASLLAELENNHGLMRSLGDRRADKNFVIKVIKKNSLAYRWADDQLKKDQDFILSVLKEYPNTMPAFMMHVDRELVADKKFALKMLALNPLAIHFLDGNLKKDNDLISATKK